MAQAIRSDFRSFHISIAVAIVEYKFCVEANKKAARRREEKFIMWAHFCHTNENRIVIYNFLVGAEARRMKMYRNLYRSAYKRFHFIFYLTFFVLWSPSYKKTFWYYINYCHEVKIVEELSEVFDVFLKMYQFKKSECCRSTKKNPTFKVRKWGRKEKCFDNWPTQLFWTFSVATFLLSKHAFCLLPFSNPQVCLFVTHTRWNRL